MSSLKRSAGFSLVELMVGMALGMIVIGGSITLYSSVSYSTALLIVNNRMQQEMRNIGLVMTRDIRRAGYSGVVPGLDFDGDGKPNAGQTNSAIQDSIRADLLFNPFLLDSADIAVYDAAGTNDCILFSYNLDGDLPAKEPKGDPPEKTPPAAVEDDEWFGYRRQVVNGQGVLQMKMDNHEDDPPPADCNSGNWKTISAVEFDVTALNFAMTTIEVEIDNLSEGTSNLCEEDDACLCIRTVDVDMTVAIEEEDEISIQFSDSIRVRNEKIAVVRSANAHCHD